MDIEHGHWNELTSLAGKAFKSCLHFAIATVNEDGTPHVSPIGSLILKDPGEAIYFEIFARQLPLNLKDGAPVSMLAVNANRWLWLRSLYSGRFHAVPAFRLAGHAGKRRPSTEQERRQWQRKVKKARYLKGHDLLWGDLSVVRELHFNRLVPVELGPMTSHFNWVLDLDR